MKIIFFGSSHFALKPLEFLLGSNHEILCVVTQPDRKKGRGLHLGVTAVKELAQKAKIKIFQPVSVNTGESLNFLKNYKADLFVVIAYGQILSAKVLDLPGIFALNIHASLLPEYRGAAPINWALIKGEKETGVTAIKMTEKMDAGPVILSNSIEIADIDNAVSLEGKLSKLASDALRETLFLIEENRFSLRGQDETKVSFAPKLHKESGLINWADSARKINCLVRGCYGWPGAYTYYKGKILKIMRTQDIGASGNLGVRDYKNGQIVEVAQDRIIIKAGEGLLKIEELQIEGRRVMSVSEFIAGHKVSVGERFSSKK